ncbi:probable WRKY transcription factor protein 1 [Sitodiplosis mosellana]|uniref:probable WRKY transcription factor protein 1 n=1 Tax=Sitodiplosis mosellana TaxID=263140 RepID=UPI002444C6B9|nr:probable WRKY transcription factor protein 1 [Sitodiplosis mosellana]
MNRNCFLRLFSIVLAVHTIQDGLIVNAASASHKARPKIDLSDPFYNGQIHYDDTLTETPIGTIVYAIDEESVEVDPFANDNTKTFQLQDVVTHGNSNDKSFINHNLFTIGDGNDAIVENDSDEDDDDDDGVADVIDIDGVVDKQATAHNSKFANFAFNDEKLIPISKADNNKNADKPSQIQLQPKHHQHQISNATDQNTQRVPHQGQQQTVNNVIASHSNRQMTYKHSNKTSTARMKSHRHHNHKPNHNGKWYRRHQKWLKQHKAKAHRNRHSSSSSASSRSGLKPQRINSGMKSNARAPSYVQAHVSFYDSSFDDDTLTSNRFTSTNNHRNGDKWPHLKRLQSQLHQDMLGDSLPPYIKKYSRRNKQLIGLLEGEGMPNVDNADTNAKQQSHPRRRQKQTNKWIEKNLFEEQLEKKKNKSAHHQDQHQQQQQQQKQQQLPPIAPYSTDGKSIIPIILNSKQRYLTEKNVQSEPNALPGEHLSLSSDDYEDCDDDSDCGPSTAVQHSKIGHMKKKKDNISPKADSFLFHRVATPKLVGTAAIAGGLIKQKLPFVALTDKRIEEDGSKQRRINTVQNTFPLP